MPETLSREELLSLRERIQDERISRSIIMSRGTMLALVDEVLRLREHVARQLELGAASSGEDTAAAVMAKIESLRVEQVGDLSPDTSEMWNRLTGALAVACARAIANGRWAVKEHQRADALAAKAEAGKALYEAAVATTSPIDGKSGRAFNGERTRRFTAFRDALAQWEATDAD
jgi:hypothetical protein